MTSSPVCPRLDLYGIFTGGAPGNLVGNRVTWRDSDDDGSSLWRQHLATYCARVRADQIAEEFPIVSAASNALGAGRLMAEQRLPGLLVTDGEGKPLAILPASEVVRMLVPGYVQDDPSLAGVLNESMADHIADAIGDKTVSAILPKPLPELPTVKSDDTIVEVAAVMAHRRAPLVAVVDEGRLVGVITASRLLEVALER